MINKSFKYFLLAFLFSVCFSIHGFCQLKNKIGIYLSIRHSDSIVKAKVLVDNKPVLYDSASQKYLLSKNLFNKRNTVISIEKPGFYPLRLKADSMFRSHGRSDELFVAAILKHPWDAVYQNGGAVVSGSAHPQYIMITNVEDTAKVFKAIKEQNLYVMGMYDYCGTTKDNYGKPEKPNTYLLMHCYGAPIAKQNSSVLRHLRSELGDDNVGPAIFSGSDRPDLLSNQLELRFKEGTTEERKKVILAAFALTEYYRDGYNPNAIVVKSDPGIGDHIIGVAHRLAQLNDVAAVRNLIHARVCTL